MLAIWLVVAVPPDLYQLGDPSWANREWCELRCRLWWPVMLPALQRRASESGDAEVRVRSERVLRVHGERVAEARATDVLTGPWIVGMGEFWEDEQLRYRVYRQVKKWGLGDGYARGLLPEYYDTWSWWACLGPVPTCYGYLTACRKQVGAGGWLFP